MCGIGQPRALKEPYVHVRGKHIDVSEGHIAQTCCSRSVVQEFPYFVSAVSHHLEPLVRNGSQFTCMLFHPRINGRTSLHCAVESQQVGFHLYTPKARG